MVMKTKNGASAARSWADIVKKEKSEIATESDKLSPLLEETVSAEEPQQLLVAGAKVAEIETSAESFQSGSIAEVEAEPEMPCEPPGTWLEQPEVQDATSPAPLRPGSRGGRQCLCRGQVINMLSHYGWIAAFGMIDHPLAAKHFGKVYIAIKDVVEGHMLAAGNMVSFYLYVDHVGLGAEACQVEPAEADGAPLPMLRKEAAEFVPRKEAAEFVPGGSYNSAVPAASAPVSDMFLRMSRTFNSIPANGYVQMVGAVNFAMFDSDSDSEDGDDGITDADQESCNDESDHSCVEVMEVLKAKPAGPLASAPWRKATPPPAQDISNDSTDAGATSESEAEDMVGSAFLRLGVGFCAFRPPPGMRLPPGLEDLVPTLV
jgi:hypothetical protein